MAVVTVLAGIMLTMGLKLATSQMDNAAYGATRKKQEALKDALIAFLGKNQYLPCPDTRPLASTTTGKIDFSAGVPDGASDIKTGYICAFETGLIPYSNLSLSPDMARDGWENYFTYQVWNGSPGDLTDPTKFTDTPRSSTGTPYGYPFTQVNPDNTTTSSKVSVIIVSHGKNGLGAFNLKGGQNLPLPDATAPAYERANTYDPASATKHSPTAPTPTPYVRKEINDTFDDVVFTITGDELVAGLRRDKTVPNMSAQATDQLAMVQDAIFGFLITNPTFNPHCRLPTNAQFLTLTSTTDPWGQTLRYTTSGFGFTVTSNGPDRTPSTADDLSVSYTDATVQGMAGKLGVNCY